MRHQSPAVLMEIVDSIAILRFNRPAERNPLSRTTLLELSALLADVKANPTRSRPLSLLAADDVFLSGANIRELPTRSRLGR